jgi:PBSX family phage terminase large subunit
MNVIWEPRDYVNESFKPYFDNKDRYLIFYGGRGSSKSDFAAKKLIYRCLTESYFRYVLVRNTYATIKDSSYQTIKDIIFDLGLDSLFEFKIQPLEIHCINGNSFLARGCDDTTKLKSIKDPTGVWWEEDIPEEKDFITVTTGVRTTKANYLQEIFTINPEVNGNYQDHWFWKRYFKDKTKKTFSDITKLNIDKDTVVDLTYSVHHSTYRDNKWIPKEFIAFLMNLKHSNPYYYTIYCEGEWGNKEIGGRFYKSFNIGDHTDNCVYNPLLPLHISFDENVNPYLPCCIFQIKGKNIMMIDEILGRTPHNTIKAICGEIKKKYYNHRSGMIIYGDATSRKQDVKIEKGYNFFYLIQNELAIYHPVLKVPQANPSIMMRGLFMNAIMGDRFAGISFKIGNNCPEAKNEFINVKEAEDGTKFKEMITDPQTKVRYQIFGHISDLSDYLVCEAFKTDFLTFQRGDISLISRSFGTGNNKTSGKRL